MDTSKEEGICILENHLIISSRLCSIVVAPASLSFDKRLFVVTITFSSVRKWHSEHNRGYFLG